MTTRRQLLLPRLLPALRGLKWQCSASAPIRIARSTVTRRSAIQLCSTGWVANGSRGDELGGGMMVGASRSLRRLGKPEMSPPRHRVVTNEKVQDSGKFLSNGGLAVAIALRTIVRCCRTLTETWFGKKASLPFRRRPSSTGSRKAGEEVRSFRQRGQSLRHYSTPVGGRKLQELLKAAAGCRVRGRTMACAGQARSREHGAGDHCGAARCSVQRHVRRGFAAAGA